LKLGVFRANDNSTVNHKILKDNITDVVTLQFNRSVPSNWWRPYFYAPSTVHNLEMVPLSDYRIPRENIYVISLIQTYWHDTMDAQEYRWTHFAIGFGEVLCGAGNILKRLPS